MINSVIFRGALLASFAFGIGATVPACSGETKSTQADPSLGSVGLQLTLPNGSTLSVVSFSVDGAALASPVVGEIPVGSNLAEISAHIGGLPAGDYTINLSGTSDDGLVACLGSANFTISAGALTGVTVPLICDAPSDRGAAQVDTTLNKCPVITSVVVAPLTNQTGYPSNVYATGSDDDPSTTLSFQWTALTGSFTDPALANTQYTCATGGTDTLTLTLDDGAGCSVSQDVDVLRVSGAVCGDGNVETSQGEQCDPPNGVDCNQNCQNIVCGDGRIDSPEVCEPPGTAACDDTCQPRTEVCGDGFVTGSEGCEPPGTAACDDTCQPRPEVCGDGFVTGGEDCEPPNTATCDATCHNIPVGAACDDCTAASCQSFITNCDNNPDPNVSSGCNQLLACIESSGCNQDSLLGGAQECYCGSVDATTCLQAVDPTVPQGPCRDLINTLAGSTLPLVVAQNLFSTSTPQGSAMSLARCQIDNCDRTCGLCTTPTCFEDN